MKKKTDFCTCMLSDIVCVVTLFGMLGASVCVRVSVCVCVCVCVCDTCLASEYVTP